MATQDLYKLQRPTVAQTNSMPSSASMQQQSKSLGGGLVGPAATNEYLAQQTRGSGGGAGFGRNQQMQAEKRMLRASTPLARASYLDNFVRQNESMRAALPDSEPFRVDLRNPVGGTMDESFNNDRELLSPEARAIQDDARKSLKGEVARLLSGANKQGWNSIEDLNDALNSLPTVQKHGPLVEGLLHQIARSAVGPEMNAKFSANDANVRSFVEWAKRSGNKLPDDVLVDAYHNGDQGLRDQFEADPNAPKYDAVGDKVQPRQITPDQQMQQGFKVEDAQRARTQQTYDSAPQEYKDAFMLDPITQQTVPRPITPQQVDQQASEINAQYQANGISKRAISMPDGKGGRTIKEIDIPEPGALSDMGNPAWKKLSTKEQMDIWTDIQAAEGIDVNDYKADTQSKLAVSKAKALKASWGLDSGAVAAQPAAATGQDAEALAWAEANPNDPRAAKIKAKVMQSGAAQAQPVVSQQQITEPPVKPDGSVDIKAHTESVPQDIKQKLAPIFNYKLSAKSVKRDGLIPAAFKFAATQELTAAKNIGEYVKETFGPLYEVNKWQAKMLQKLGDGAFKLLFGTSEGE